MKFTLSWLKEYLETTVPPEKIVDTLNKIGLETESFSNRAEELRSFNCVQVESVEKHPNADNLHLCRVRTNDSEIPLEIVCGAPNVTAGMKTIFAPVGSVLPGEGAQKIERVKIRGVYSDGMLCSEKELCLGNDSDGIVELDKNVKIGANVADIFGLSDPIIEISITPNRGDCLGVYGIARDLAAAGLGKLRKLENIDSNLEINNPTGKPRHLTLETANCPRFFLREVKNIKNCRSPQWLENRLKVIGLNPKNALVDISNYIMFSLGKPLHFYDLSAIEGNLVVRDSREGENFTDLFGVAHRLPAGAVVICDEKKILCLGGIVGSSSGCINEKTKDIIIESAIFDPINIAKTKKTLNIQTDAAYRFERGNDHNVVDFALEYASALIYRICGGGYFSETANHEHDSYRKSLKKTIRLAYGQIEKRLGLKIAKKEVSGILKSLGYSIEAETKKDGDDSLLLEVPSFRRGIECKEEVIDDIIRIYGYDNLIDGDFTDSEIYETENSLFYRKFEDNLHRIRKRLMSNGMTELVTYSFLRKKDCSYFSEAREDLDLINPIISDFSHMRQNMIPNILNAIAKNENRGSSDLSFFEIGHVYNECALDRENNVICGIRYGNYESKSCYGEARKFDIFDVKKDMFDILALFRLGDSLIVKRGAPKYYHQGRSGAVFGENEILLGYFGELHPAIAEKFSLRDRPVIFEFFVDNIDKKTMLGDSRTTDGFVSNDLQSLTRDFSFIIDEKEEVGNIIRDIGDVDRLLISKISLFDIYNYGDGKKSVGLTIEIQPRDKTLNKNEISALSSAVVELVASKYGGILRDK
ncbi:MAG: phenylalanine--tRNA ligase subunit beta [Rickettsiales bacterium]|jgi:phenylalanyl-tRNA synthetase beta chain|nr:phenylalanine--tRNA ligase subunit beta [Rickettsiales bacterium]